VIHTSFVHCRSSSMLVVPKCASVRDPCSISCTGRAVCCLMDGMLATTRLSRAALVADHVLGWSFFGCMGCVSTGCLGGAYDPPPPPRPVISKGACIDGDRSCAVIAVFA
jgi:hypothetical protein